MRRVYVTVGPRWAGKSTCCSKVVAANPGVVLVSRDAILLERFGAVELDPETGAFAWAKDAVWKQVSRYLRRENATLMLDLWNADAEDRHTITRHLRRLGADYIEAWYFITPLEVCYGWWLEDLNKMHGADPAYDWLRESDYYASPWHAYHAEPVRLDQGFDTVREINASELELPLELVGEGQAG